MKLVINLFLLTSILFAACKKNEEHNDSGQVVIRGTNRLIVSVMHHTWAVTNADLFLKNNAVEFPGTDTLLYNWKKTSDISGIAVFDNLFEGNYFLYAKGFDQVFGANVIGASPAVLNSSTLTNNEIYVTLYVTE